MFQAKWLKVQAKFEEKLACSLENDMRAPEHLKISKLPL